MEIVEGEFPAWCQVAAFQQGRKPYAYSFLWERRTSGVMPGRKPFAKSFLFGMKPQCFSRVGNSLQIVSRPAGDKGVSSE